MLKINKKSRDNQCFKYAVLAGLHNLGKNSSDVLRYRKYENELKFDGIYFPVKLKDISKCERNNNISVNLYTLKKYDNNFDTVPLHLPSFEYEKHVDLLLIQDNYIDENCIENDNYSNFFDTNVSYHYVLIRNYSRLISKQVSDKNGKIISCKRCMCFFS